MSHAKFLKEFEKSLPKFLQSQSKEIAEDIIDLMRLAIQRDGIEIRGYFSIKEERNSMRNTIKFRDLSKNP